MEPGVLIPIMVVSGILCAGIAASKNRFAFGYFLLGCLAPLLGIVVSLIVSRIETPQEREARLRAEGMQVQIGAMQAWNAMQAPGPMTNGNPPPHDPRWQSYQPAAAPVTTAAADPAVALTQLKDLAERGLITPEEYEQQRRRVLERLV